MRRTHHFFQDHRPRVVRPWASCGPSLARLSPAPGLRVLGSRLWALGSLGSLGLPASDKGEAACLPRATLPSTRRLISGDLGSLPILLFLVAGGKREKKTKRVVYPHALSSSFLPALPDSRAACDTLLPNADEAPFARAEGWMSGTWWYRSGPAEYGGAALCDGERYQRPFAEPHLRLDQKDGLGSPTPSGRKREP
jgi:hypothetical protein